MSPAARGSGAGRALIEAVVERARSRGLEKVYWHTRERQRSRPHAVRLVRGRGRLRPLRRSAGISSGILRPVTSRVRAAVLLVVPALACCNGSDDESPMAVTEPAAAGVERDGGPQAHAAVSDLKRRRVGELLGADVRHGPARRSQQALRGRAGRDDSRRPARAQTRPAISRHPRPGPVRGRARPPVDGLRPELPQEPALLRLLHGRPGRHPGRRVQGSPQPGAQGQRANGVHTGPQHVREPQRRPGPVRSRRLPLHRHGRRRRGRGSVRVGPGRRQQPREAPADQSRRRAAHPALEPVPRPPGREARPSTRTACATRGGSRSIARPATS